MPDTKLMTGRDLGKAICSHFGLNINQVQSDYRIKTEPGELASVTLTIILTPDDLAGIARKAGATIHRGGYLPADLRLVGERGPEVIHTPLAGSTSRSDGDAAAQELKLKVDTSSLDDLVERMERYAQMHYGCAAAALRSVEAIQGEALAIEPDPRLDEIVTLLRRLVGIAEAEKAGRRMMFDAVSVDGCQRGPKSGHWVDEHGIRHTDIGGQG